MACIRKRRGKWVVDYRDSLGERRWKTCKTKREADEVLAAKIRESRQVAGHIVDLDISVADYTERWLNQIAPTIKPRTLDSYSASFRVHLLPRFGSIQIQKLHRGMIKDFLSDKLSSGQSRNSVRIMYSALRAMLNEAVEDGIIVANPADRLGKKLKLFGEKNDLIKALNREQLMLFLSKADEWYKPFFLLLSRTGLRLGEAIALEITDLDLEQYTIKVNKAYSRGEVTTPKTGKERTVDVSDQLAESLKGMIAERKKKYVKKGKAMPQLLFPSWAGTPLNASNIRRAFNRTLKKAKLPEHFTPHCLRHTFASILVQQGESLAYVQRMLGHSSIRLTVDIYGKWLPMGNKAAVDRLDDEKAA